MFLKLNKQFVLINLNIGASFLGSVFLFGEILPFITLTELFFLKFDEKRLWNAFCLFIYSNKILLLLNKQSICETNLFLLKVQIQYAIYLNCELLFLDESRASEKVHIWMSVRFEILNFIFYIKFFNSENLKKIMYLFFNRCQRIGFEL